MTWRYAVQFAVPLVLMASLLWLPARTALGCMAQDVGNSGNSGNSGSTGELLAGELRAIKFNHHFPVRGDRIEAS